MLSCSYKKIQKIIFSQIQENSTRNIKQPSNGYNSPHKEKTKAKRTVIQESSNSDNGDNDEKIQSSIVAMDRISILNNSTEVASQTEGSGRRHSTTTINSSPRNDNVNFKDDTETVVLESNEKDGPDGSLVDGDVETNNTSTGAGNDINITYGDNNSYGDDDDMYFMEDGGYNSFVLELPPTEPSEDKESSSHNNSRDVAERSLVVEESISKSEKDSPEGTKDATTISAINEPESNNVYQHTTSISTDKGDSANFGLVSAIHHDSFDVSDLEKAEHVDLATFKTPKGKSIGRNTAEGGEFQTPTGHPSLLMNQSELANDGEFATPQQPRDKDACKAFQPGCSKHPETKEAITPMPDFAQLPTPNLKVCHQCNASFTLEKNNFYRVYFNNLFPFA